MCVCCLQGFFVPYLTGSLVIVVLAVGSTAPGLLQAVIGWFAQVFPDYRERVLRHEAAHFLVYKPSCSIVDAVSTLSVA